MQRLAWIPCFVLAVSALACLAGCKDDSEVRATKTVTEKDFGKAIYLRRGNTLGVVLLEPREARYKWNCSWSPKPKMELACEVLIREAPDTTGAGGERHFILRVLEPGRTIVTVRRGRESPRSYIIRAQ
jgi:predicted secreted protein